MRVIFVTCWLIILLSCNGLKGQGEDISGIVENPCEECVTNGIREIKSDDESQKPNQKRRYMPQTAVDYAPNLHLGNSRWKSYLQQLLNEPSPRQRKFISGQKRERTSALLAADPGGQKREPTFSSWGGKRSVFQPWGGKRAEFQPWGGKKRTFYTWGAKKSVENELEKFGRILSNTDPKVVEMPEEQKRKKRTTSYFYQRGAARETLKQLIENYLNLSRKNPEYQKKDRTQQMRALHGTGGDTTNSHRPFFQWGGKRSYYHPTLEVQ